MEKLLCNTLLRNRQITAFEFRYHFKTFFQLLIGLDFFTDGLGLLVKPLSQIGSQNCGPLEVVDRQLALVEGELVGSALPLVGIEEDFSEVSR